MNRLEWWDDSAGHPIAYRIGVERPLMYDSVDVYVVRYRFPSWDPGTRPGNEPDPAVWDDTMVPEVWSVDGGWAEFDPGAQLPCAFRVPGPSLIRNDYKQDITRLIHDVLASSGIDVP